MVVNLSMQSGDKVSSEAVSKKSGDSNIRMYELDLTLLSREALVPIAEQLCLTCNQRYSDEVKPGLLPCDHYFCTKCIKSELSRQREEAQKQSTSFPDDASD